MPATVQFPEGARVGGQVFFPSLWMAIADVQVSGILSSSDLSNGGPDSILITSVKMYSRFGMARPGLSWYQNMRIIEIVTPDTAHSRWAVFYSSLVLEGWGCYRWPAPYTHTEKKIREGREWMNWNPSLFLKNHKTREYLLRETGGRKLISPYKNLTRTARIHARDNDNMFEWTVDYSRAAQNLETMVRKVLDECGIADSTKSNFPRWGGTWLSDLMVKQCPHHQLAHLFNLMTAVQRPPP